MRHLTSLLPLAILLCLFMSTGAKAASLLANDKANNEEVWEGTLDYVTAKFRLVLKFTRESDRSIKGILISLDQNSAEFSFEPTIYKDSYVHFEIEPIAAVFEGAISRDGSELAGRWTQPSGPRPLVLKRTDKGFIPKNVQPQTKRGTVQLSPCNSANLTKDALCGTYEVYEDRVHKSGRKISLNMTILPALATKPQSDAVFYLSGGPGAGSAVTVQNGGDFVTKFRRERDVVFIDQRGTGKSNPLQCELYGDKNDMRGYFGEGITKEKIAACRAQLEKIANLEQYTSDNSIDDFDEVRAALGYDKINLLGGSYGSTAALVFMRRHPNQIRSAIIEGVAPTNYKVPLPFAKGVQQAMNRLIADCAADKECGKSFPKFREEFESILAKLEKEPATFQAINPYTRQSQQVTLTRDTFVDHIRVMLYAPEYSRYLPFLIHQVNQGNFLLFASISFQIFKSVDDQIARGLQLCIACSEDTPFITEEEIKRETAGSFYGDHKVRAWIESCKQWTKGKADASFLEPVKSPIPTLILSGAIDPVTPPQKAEEVARNLPNSRHIVINNAGHAFNSECLDTLRAEFIAKGSAKKLDAACVETIQRPPFAVRIP